MFRLLLRLGLFVVAFCVTTAPALAQVQWNVTYADGNIGAGGVGFADPTVSGSTTVGQLRRNSVTAATTYLSTVLDGRGTMNLRFDASLTSGTGFEAQFGPNQILGTSGGSFQNGGLYQAARTNQHVFGSVDGGGQFNFGYGWNYDGQSASASNYDMVSVAIHEITHGLGFLSFTNASGSGWAGRTVGTPDIYSGFDRYLQRGNGSGGALLNADIANSGFGSFNASAVSTLTNGNNPSIGLFFGGAYTREVLSGPAALYAQSPYEDKSTASHVADSNGLMSPNFALNTVKRLQNYEIAMLMDIGWNVYNWNGTDGNWAAGANNVNQSHWRSNLGIVTNGSQEYNTFTNPGQAPVLPVYGQVTSNIVLNFGGSGSTGYTAMNDIGTVRLVRLNLNSTATQTNTLTGGTLLFGQNSDGTNAVLAPKIVQQNSGAFAINSNLQIPIGLTIDGTGIGLVSLGGAISGNGGLTKSGGFTLEVNGSSANTFTGSTTVNSGVLLLNKTPGVNAIAGDMTINPGGTLRLGAANQLPSSGVVHLAGGTLSTGAGSGFSDSIGALQVTASSTISLGSGSHALTFSGISGTPTGSLTVTNWSGNMFETGTGGKLFFENLGSDLDTINTTYASFLANVQFTGLGAGGTFITTGTSGMVELVAAPEPLTVLGVASAALGVAGIIRRRGRRDDCVVSA